MSVELHYVSCTSAKFENSINLFFANSVGFLNERKNLFQRCEEDTI